MTPAQSDPGLDMRASGVDHGRTPGGHGDDRDVQEGCDVIDDKATNEKIVAATDDEDDVQGNMLLPDPTLNRELARARDRELQRRAEERRLLQDSRRVSSRKK